MDKRLIEVRDDLRQKTLHNRSLEAIVMSDKFERLWEDSSVEHREKVTLLIQFGYKSKVAEWIKNHESLELGERPLAYLRDRARDLRIKNYSRLQKGELISLINKKEQDYAKDKG